MSAPPTFSHSRLSTLDDCPRRYAFRYVEGLKEAFQTAEAFMGTMVHEALQWLYLEREAGRSHPVAALVDRYRSTFRERLTPQVRVVQDDARLERFEDEGEEMLRRHHQARFLEDRLETVAVEPRVELRLGEHAYIGYVDRLARDAEGTLHVIDYKTGRSVPPSAEAAGTQVRSYGLAVLEQHGGVHVELAYEYLRPGTVLAERFTREQGGGLAADLRRRIERALAAEKAGAFPARPSGLCRWCGFRETCDASGFTAAPVAPVARAAAPRPAVPAAAAGTCPHCGSALRLRTSSRSRLLACERYPDCGYARDGGSA